MSASALLHWAVFGGALWAGLILLIWAVCRAAALADADDAARRAAAAPPPALALAPEPGAASAFDRELAELTPDLEPEIVPDGEPMPLAAAVVAAAAVWLESDDGALFSGVEAGDLHAVAMTASADQDHLRDAAGEAVEQGVEVEVRLNHNGSSTLVIATPVLCDGRLAGALAFGLDATGARLGFAQRRALGALADAAAALPVMTEAATAPELR